MAHGSKWQWDTRAQTTIKAVVVKEFEEVELEEAEEEEDASNKGAKGAMRAEGLTSTSDVGGGWLLGCGSGGGGW